MLSQHLELNQVLLVPLLNQLVCLVPQQHQLRSLPGSDLELNRQSQHLDLEQQLLRHPRLLSVLAGVFSVKPLLQRPRLGLLLLNLLHSGHQRPPLVKQLPHQAQLLDSHLHHSRLVLLLELLVLLVQQSRHLALVNLLRQPWVLRLLQPQLPLEVFLVRQQPHLLLLHLVDLDNQLLALVCLVNRLLLQLPSLARRRLTICSLHPNQLVYLVRRPQLCRLPLAVARCLVLLHNHNSQPNLCLAQQVSSQHKVYLPH